MAQVTVTNEDGETIFTSTMDGATETVLRRIGEAFLLGITAERRMGSDANDTDWLATIEDNGFYTIHTDTTNWHDYA